MVATHGNNGKAKMAMAGDSESKETVSIPRRQRLDSEYTILVHIMHLWVWLKVPVQEVPSASCLSFRRLPSPWCFVALVSYTARLGGSLVWLARPL